jgi:hypothetical protein
MTLVTSEALLRKTKANPLASPPLNKESVVDSYLLVSGDDHLVDWGELTHHGLDLRIGRRVRQIHEVDTPGQHVFRLSWGVTAEVGLVDKRLNRADFAIDGLVVEARHCLIGTETIVVSYHNLSSFKPRGALDEVHLLQGARQ